MSLIHTLIDSQNVEKLFLIYRGVLLNVILECSCAHEQIKILKLIGFLYSVLSHDDVKSRLPWIRTRVKSCYLSLGRQHWNTRTWKITATCYRIAYCQTNCVGNGNIYFYANASKGDSWSLNCVQNTIIITIMLKMMNNNKYDGNDDKNITIWIIKLTMKKQ